MIAGFWLGTTRWQILSANLELRVVDWNSRLLGWLRKVLMILN